MPSLELFTGGVMAFLRFLYIQIKKTWLLIISCAFIISLSYLALLQHYSTPYNDLVYVLESEIFDRKERARGQDHSPTKVGILAIDEESLDEFGRWPFSRRFYAQAFANLKKLGVKWIGFDAIWAEPEKTLLEDVTYEFDDMTPQNLSQKLERISALQQASPSDRVFVEGISDFENIVMGYFYFGSKQEAELNLGHSDFYHGLEPMLSSELAYDEDHPLDHFPLSKSYGLVANDPFYSSASSHFAFFSNDADDDAINRWVTLVANINGHLMPSLSLKTAAEYLDSEIFVLFDNSSIEAIVLVNRETEEEIEIPVDPRGQGKILVNHRGPGRGFHFFSLADAYNNSFSPEEEKALDGALLLLGATANGINDMRPNPFDPTIDGVENHAAVVDNILKQDFYKRPRSIYGLELMIVLVVGLLFAPLFIWGRAVISGLAVIGFLVGYYLVDKYVWFGNGQWIYMAVPSLEILSMFIVTNLIKYVTEEKDKRFLKQAFSSYISPELIEDMHNSGEPPKLGGDLGVLTAYFTDIQSFSSFSEKLTAPQLVELLNEYLTAMTDILLAEKGTLDKYEGDAIIAFIGAPMKLEDHAARALRVAVGMQDKLLELRAKWVSEGDKWPDIVKEMRMRIGINSGEIVTGNMGSRDRMNYTMMGDSVNLAARLEEAAKQYGIFTQVSQFTKELAGEGFELRELDTIRVVGKTEPVTTYDLLGISGKIDSNLVELKDRFHEGLALYKQMEWDRAMTAFEASLECEYKRFPELKGKKTNPSEIYIERCKEFKANPPGDDWDGVYTLTKK